MKCPNCGGTGDVLVCNLCKIEGCSVCKIMCAQRHSQSVVFFQNLRCNNTLSIARAVFIVH